MMCDVLSFDKIQQEIVIDNILPKQERGLGESLLYFESLWQVIDRKLLEAKGSVEPVWQGRRIYAADSHV